MTPVNGQRYLKNIKLRAWSVSPQSIAQNTIVDNKNDRCFLELITVKNIGPDVMQSGFGVNFFILVRRILGKFLGEF